MPKENQKTQPIEEPEFSSRNVRSNIAPIFQILQSEQNILQRTDQKAFTLMSILGVFMVFFIVHFLKININWFNVVMVIIYFIAAFFAIANLMLVIVPRIRNDQDNEALPDINATFFGGIIQFKNPVEYAEYLNEITDDHEKTYKMFASQLYALGSINAYKNKHLRRAIMFFGTAILCELLIIMSMAWGRALQFLFPS
ncbi:MAG: DUF5706 domain-containing protein [Candidatus Marinimicrobia bacterium]|jgi:hypothetical protein|nr:DUF5706 domain-containing protein [Candidatus Neomarinimicrobiota bacterium]MDP6612126.1 DUF5706 domain-containing protein [Candidatus Neomarinimicrobiota bacterium]|tara:strand:- start:3360 stop:3953 length:594 start_codon:yes stop_codon:yes gene_type:complete